MKLYPINVYGVKSKELKEVAVLMGNIRKGLDEMQDDPDKSDAVILYNANRKVLYNQLRRIIKSENLISIGVHKTQDEVLVVEFDKKADDSNYYPISQDENGEYYIEVEDEVKDTCDVNNVEQQ